MKPKLIKRNIPPDRENTNDRFRVKFNSKSDFEKLEVEITRLASGEQQLFKFDSALLPDKDSIYFSTSVVDNKFHVKWHNMHPSINIKSEAKQIIIKPIAKPMNQKKLMEK